MSQFGKLAQFGGLFAGHPQPQTPTPMPANWRQDYADRMPAEPHPQTGPLAPAAQKLGGWDKLSLIGATLRDVGSGGDTQALQSLGEGIASRKSLQELLAMADSAGLSPMEKLAFRTNPAKFMADLGPKLAELRGYHTAGPGQRAYFGDPAQGGYVDDVPVTGHDGGQFFTQTPDGVDFTGRREPSYAEILQQAQQDATATRAAQEAEFERRKAELEREIFGETVRHNKATEGIQSQRERRIGAGGGLSGGYSPNSIKWDQ